MATHECSKCLEMTIRGVKESSELPANTVLATSVCGAAGSGGTHLWTPLTSAGWMSFIILHFYAFELSIDANFYSINSILFLMLFFAEFLAVLALADSRFVVGGASAVVATRQGNNSLLVAVYFC